MAGSMEEAGRLLAHVLVLFERNHDALIARRVVAFAVELGTLDAEAIGSSCDVLVHVPKERLDLSDAFFRGGHICWLERSRGPSGYG
jgi:hypothetical protein